MDDSPKQFTEQELSRLADPKVQTELERIGKERLSAIDDYGKAMQDAQRVLKDRTEQLAQQEAALLKGD